MTSSAFLTHNPATVWPVPDEFRPIYSHAAELQAPARALFISARQARISPAPMGWVGPHEYLARHDGRFFIEDGLTSASRPAVGVPADARVLTEVGDRVVWATRDGEVHAATATGGADDVLGIRSNGLDAFFGALGKRTLFVYQEGSFTVIDLPGSN